MSVMDWVGTVGAIWLAVSLLVGIFWALAGKRIFRNPPVPAKPGHVKIEIVAQDNASPILREVARKASELRRLDGRA